jgi:hypothetical protein
LTLCWRSFWGVTVSTNTMLPIKAAIPRCWINAVAQPLDYTWCNTQNRWRSVDTHIQSGAVTISRSLLHRTAANTLSMDICHSRALGLYKMQNPKSFTLCWHSVDAVLTLCWCSVDALLTLIWYYIIIDKRYYLEMLPILRLWIYVIA